MRRRAPGGGARGGGRAPVAPSAMPARAACPIGFAPGPSMCARLRGRSGPGPRSDQRARQDGRHGPRGALAGVAGQDLPVGRGRGGAEPSKRPRAAWRRFDPPRPQRPPAGPDAGEYVLAGGRKGGDLAGSRTTTGAWRWPGWSPRAMAGQAAIDVFDKGVAARGAHPAPARPTTARPRAPAGAESPAARPGHVRSLGVEPPAGRPYRPTTQGRQRALPPDPAPPPGPAAPGRLHRRAPGRRVDRFDHTLQHPAPPPGPARAHHRAAGLGRHRGGPGTPTGPRHRPHHPRRRTRARRARRAPTAAPAQAHRPQRRARSRPSPATGADHIGGIAFLVRRALAGHRTTAIRDATTITFADVHGEVLIQYNWPPEGVTYVSHHPPDPTNQRGGRGRRRPQPSPKS